MLAGIETYRLMLNDGIGNSSYGCFLSINIICNAECIDLFDQQQRIFAITPDSYAIFAEQTLQDKKA